MTRWTMLRPLFVLLAVMIAIPYAAASPIGYMQVNLVSNSPGVAPAPTYDSNLVNPWGLAASATSPFWVSDQGSGVSTLYSASGVLVPKVVTVPPLSPPPAGPTGIVFNSTKGFLVNTAAASFIFATLAGTINGWNSTAGSTAVVEATDPGAVFTGLAAGNTVSGNFLYATDFANAQIDVFGSTYAPASLGGSFTDPSLPAGYAPYNIQNINGTLYVAYALQGGPHGEPVVAPGDGIVDEFDTNGNFLQRVATGGPLDAPWGIALAPASFGQFGGDLLVGNFGNGEIDAFTPAGAFQGTIDNALGQPLVNNFLWALDFGSGANSNTLYFTAGLDNQAGGLFGDIQPTPGAHIAASVRLRPGWVLRVQAKGKGRGQKLRAYAGFLVSSGGPSGTVPFPHTSSIVTRRPTIAAARCRLPSPSWLR